jgi:hypothetical protein
MAGSSYCTFGLDSPEIEYAGGGEIFRTRPDRHWGPPSVLYFGSWSFRGLKRSGRGVDHPPHLAPRLKKENRAIRPLLLWAFMAGYRLTFTFTTLAMRHIRHKHHHQRTAALPLPRLDERRELVGLTVRDKWHLLWIVQLVSNCLWRFQGICVWNKKLLLAQQMSVAV